MSREARLSILLAALALPAAALAVTLDSWAWLAAQVALQAAAFALVLRHHFHAERGESLSEAIRRFLERYVR